MSGRLALSTSRSTGGASIRDLAGGCRGRRCDVRSLRPGDWRSPAAGFGDVAAGVHAVLARCRGVCVRCGRIRPVHARTLEGPVCVSCHQCPLHECGRCGAVAQWHTRPRDGQPGYCVACHERALRSCAACGKSRKVSRSEAADGAWMCDLCRARKSRCDLCGTVDRIIAPTTPANTAAPKASFRLSVPATRASPNSVSGTCSRSTAISRHMSRRWPSPCWGPGPARRSGAGCHPDVAPPRSSPLSSTPTRRLTMSYSTPYPQAICCIGCVQSSSPAACCPNPGRGRR
jgi:hypothetical protein